MNLYLAGENQSIKVHTKGETNDDETQESHSTLQDMFRSVVLFQNKSKYRTHSLSDD